MYPKADPTPVTSSAPPVSTLYTSPVVRQLSELSNYHVLCSKLLEFVLILTSLKHINFRTPLLHQLKM